MSPEVIREEKKEVDCRTDIWSFGCVLYEMITREVLFNNKAIHPLMDDILKKEIQIPTRVEACFEFLLKKCKFPRMRYSSNLVAFYFIN
jgi:serine/threonine protein kinase